MAAMINRNPQTDSVYILCRDKEKHEKWTNEWPKVKGIFTEIGLVSKAIYQRIRQCDNDLIPVSFLAQNDALLNQNLDELEPSFMYSMLLKEIILELGYKKEDIQGLVNYCMKNYDSLDIGLQTIIKFEQEYYTQTPIWWYTFPGFIYQILNRALRNLETNIIVNMGFFIRDLHRQIENLYSEQFQKEQGIFTVYRGQSMSLANFEKMKKTQGGLISFNNFLSTSRDRNISLFFAEASIDNEESMRVLFHMIIDLSISSTPFALIDNFSYYDDSEQEILFSMHTVFRIGEIKEIQHRLWQVELTLTNDTDPQLSVLTQRIREETRGWTGWHRLGCLLIKTGNFVQAEEIYEILLQQASKNDEREQIVYNFSLGQIQELNGEYDQALYFYTKALEIQQRLMDPDNRILGLIYCNMGSVYGQIGEYSKALLFSQHSLEIEETSPSANDTILAANYENIGLVHASMREYLTALPFLEKSLEIKKKFLPLNHPRLGIAYNNIGGMYDSIEKYSKALEFYKKGLEIKQKSLPSDHPDLANSYNNVGMIHQAIGEYSEAMEYCEKALNIYEKSLPSNHPNLAAGYNNIGSLCQHVGDYCKALEYYKKSLEILEKKLSPNHSTLASSYENIGLVYEKLGEYLKAREYYGKSFEILRKTYPSNHSIFVRTYICFTSIYIKLGDYTEALSTLKKCFKIQEETLEKSNPTLAVTYSWFGKVYLSLKDYSMALTFFQKALEIFKSSFPKKHPTLVIRYNNIGDAHRLAGNYSTALSFYEKALSTHEDCKCNSLDLAIVYNNMGETYQGMHDYATALSFHFQALEIRERLLPKIHPDLAVTHHNLAHVFNATGKYCLAIEHATMAVEMAKEKLPETHPHLLNYAETLTNMRKIF